jgi:hypothetical protein
MTIGEPAGASSRPSRRVIARVMTVALIAGTLGACARASGDDGARPTARRPAEASCRAGQVRITLRRGISAGPLVGGYLAFTNVGRSTCVLRGWPALTGEFASHRRSPALDVTTTQFGPNVRRVPRVELPARAHADAVFFTDAEPGPHQRSCPRPYRWLVVGLPHRRANVRLSAWIPYRLAYLPACSRVYVSMIVSANSLYHG